jgi:hypothetical protein
MAAATMNSAMTRVITENTNRKHVRSVVVIWSGKYSGFDGIPHRDIALGVSSNALSKISAMFTLPCVYDSQFCKAREDLLLILATVSS